jgi:hypothetical protein
MNRSKSLIVLTVISLAVLCSSMYIINSTAYANSAVGNSPQGPFIPFIQRMMGQWFRVGGGQVRGPNGLIQVSAGYNQTVINIAKSDADVQNLLAQGYSVQGVRPIIKSVVQADGTVVTSAPNAVVLLVNGTTGRAAVYVDVTNGKVTQIVIQTRTVINK